MKPIRPAIRAHRPQLTLLIVLLGYLTFPMSMSGTTIALPEIGRDLDASGASLQWVVTGYFLTASAFMLVAGSLGDLFGRRKVYATGAAVYTAGTLVASAAPDILVLDAARTLSGIGAAGVMAGGGAILATAFEGPARTKVFATVGTVAGIGIAVGPTVSGALVGAFGWRTAFLVFAVAGVVIVSATFLMSESRATARPHLDKAGAVTFIAALGLVMFAVTQGGQAGWASPRVLAPLLGGLALIALFVRVERRAARPMLDLALLRNRRFMGWIVGATSVAIGSTGVMIFFPTYLQGANGLTAGDAGLVMLMMTAPVFVVPQIGGRLVNRGVPPRHLLGTALLLSAAGNALLVLLLHPGAGAATLAAPLILIGVAGGLSMGLVDAQAMSMVGREQVGMASGLLNTIRAGSNSLVLAIFGAALITLVQTRVGDAALAADVAAGKLAGPRHAELAGQFTYAWQVALTLVALTLAVAAVLVHRMLAPSKDRPAAPHVPAEPVATPPARRVRRGAGRRRQAPGPAALTAPA
ncbi:arabinose ABC transporter permease [Streptomyces agglomeratus]|uniref:Arabinose ABC transporter permease n=1 Tax=Streptomyces agglomeratus TaxID=285458 RepID=A0A1E5PCS5_9ACTN|nr:MFS transporter [Streptomyces agglomeratus]OEJ27342.1 arabinose ABC transporter permease [Streptomyces agglomeratus]